MASIPQPSPYGVVYLIHCTTNDAVYVGKTTKALRERWAKHRRELRGGRHRNPHLQHCWNKHGEQSFEYVVLEEAYSEDDLNESERFHIAYFRAVGARLANLRSGGEGGWWSGEILRRLSEQRRGIPLSEAHRKRLSEAQRKRPPITEETRRKRSEALKGRQPSDLARQRSIEACKGKPLSEEHRRKVSEAGRGRIVSEESRQRMSQARKNRRTKNDT